VADEQGQGVGLGRADVQEVDGLAVDLGGELGQGVEPGLLGPPVEPVLPVAGQLPQVAGRDPGPPVVAVRPVGPAGAGQPLAQVVQVAVGDVDAERPDLGVCGRGLPPRSVVDAGTLSPIAECIVP